MMIACFSHVKNNGRPALLQNLLSLELYAAASCKNTDISCLLLGLRMHCTHHTASRPRPSAPSQFQLLTDNGYVLSGNQLGDRSDPQDFRMDGYLSSAAFRPSPGFASTETSLQLNMCLEGESFFCITSRIFHKTLPSVTVSLNINNCPYVSVHLILYFQIHDPRLSSLPAYHPSHLKAHFAHSVKPYVSRARRRPLRH